MSTPHEHPPLPPQQGISLQELSEAFARVLSDQPESPLAAQATPTALDSPSAPPAESTVVERTEPAESVQMLDSGGEPPAPSDESSDDDNSCQLSPRTILEAMLFVGNRQNEPLSAQQVSALMRGVAPEEVPALVEELNQRYREDGCPYEILAESGGYRMALREEFYLIRNRLYGRAREARLSQAAIDVLAIVAYRQPLTGDEVSRVRGKPSGHVLAQLVRRQLLRIERSEEKPRKTRYGTTGRFLALFGLESLDDLPQSDELDKR